MCSSSRCSGVPAGGWSVRTAPVPGNDLVLGGATAGSGAGSLNDLLGLVEVAGHQEKLAEQPPDSTTVELLEFRVAAHPCVRPRRR